jgi:hypothetical protein
MQMALILRVIYEQVSNNVCSYLRDFVGTYAVDEQLAVGEISQKTCFRCLAGLEAFQQIIGL